MSKNTINLDKYTPLEIITAIKARDKRFIKILVRDGILVKKIWTQLEVAEMLDVNPSTVSRWLKEAK